MNSIEHPLRRRFMLAFCFVLAVISSSSTMAEPVVSSSPRDEIHEPVFRAGSFWVFHITSRRQSEEVSLNLQWTLLYQNTKKLWVFSRRTPDSELPSNIPLPISGVTDTGWAGRDHGGDLPESLREPLFPLYVGKSWISETPLDNGTLHKCTSSAIAWEDVTVTAGIFHTIRIESECTTVGPTSTDAAFHAASRTTRWYSPLAQNFVREFIYFQSSPIAGTSFELIDYQLKK